MDSAKVNDWMQVVGIFALGSFIGVCRIAIETIPGYCNRLTVPGKNRGDLEHVYGSYRSRIFVAALQGTFK